MCWSVNTFLLLSKNFWWSHIIPVTVVSVTFPNQGGQKKLFFGVDICQQEVTTVTPFHSLCSKKGFQISPNKAKEIGNKNFAFSIYVSSYTLVRKLLKEFLSQTTFKEVVLAVKWTVYLNVMWLFWPGIVWFGGHDFLHFFFSTEQTGLWR